MGQTSGLLGLNSYLLRSSGKKKENKLKKFRHLLNIKSDANAFLVVKIRCKNSRYSL